MAVIDGTTGIDLVQDNAITTADIQNAAITAAKLSGAQTGSAPVYGCRAWCYFNGTTAGTNAPTAGGNVTSVTRNATGDYTVTFATAMPDANYAVAITPIDAATVCTPKVSTRATSTFRFQVGNSSSGAVMDVVDISIQVTR